MLRKASLIVLFAAKIIRLLVNNLRVLSKKTNCLHDPVTFHEQRMRFSCLQVHVQMRFNILRHQEMYPNVILQLDIWPEGPIIFITNGNVIKQYR